MNEAIFWAVSAMLVLILYVTWMKKVDAEDDETPVRKKESPEPKAADAKEDDRVFAEMIVSMREVTDNAEKNYQGGNINFDLVVWEVLSQQMGAILGRLQIWTDVPREVLDEGMRVGIHEALLQVREAHEARCNKTDCTVEDRLGALIEEYATGVEETLQ